MRCHIAAGLIRGRAGLPAVLRTRNYLPQRPKQLCCRCEHVRLAAFPQGNIPEEEDWKVDKCDILLGESDGGWGATECSFTIPGGTSLAFFEGWPIYRTIDIGVPSEAPYNRL